MDTARQRGQGTPALERAYNSSVHNDSDRPVDQKTEALRKNVSNWLRWAMRSEPHRLGTQPKVAEAAGIAQSSVSRILKAKQGITLEMLAALEKVTGIAAYKLLLDCPDASLNPPDNSEGRALMMRLQSAPKEISPESQHEGSQPRAAGVHRHSQKPAPRKKRSPSSNT